MQRSLVLFWALFFFLGTCFAIHPHWAYSIPILFLQLICKRKFQCLVFLLMGFGFATLRSDSNPPTSGDERGIFTLESISPTQSPFVRSLALKGHLQTDTHNIPCVLFQKKVPSGTKWILEGKLQEGIFKPKKHTPWIELNSPFSLVRWRFDQKEAVRNYFHKKTKDKRVGHFFASMATGDIDDRLLAMEFRKLGLGHILAISGFHFALIAGMLGWCFRLFLPPKVAYATLLFFLTFYFIYLGFSPSILRAYVMIALFILGRFLRRQIDVLNLLGAALLIELILDPLTLTQVGFQLSFLATLGILLFFAPCNRLLQYLLPKRSFSEVKALPCIDQHGYLLSSTIRQGLALSLAIHLTTLPAVLYTFHSFPLLSLPYNLLFPPFLSISLALIPLGVLFPPLDALNVLYTSFLLKLIANPPEMLNFKIFSNHFPFPLLIALITLTGILGLIIKQKEDTISVFLWRS